MSEMTATKDRKNAKVAVQQYTKTAAHLDQLGEQARKLRQEMAETTDAVAETREEIKGYNERRREQTAKLKEILKPIVRHLQAGGTANGVTGLHNWAAWYNPTAKDGKTAPRQIMRIVNSLEPGEKGDIKSPKATKVIEGQIVTFSYFLDKNDEPIKVKFKITALPAGISELWGDKNDRSKRFGTIGVELIKEEEAQEPAKLVHARGLTHKGTTAKRVAYCEYRMPNKPRERSKLFVKADEDVTCPDCIRIRKEDDVRKAEREARMAETAEPETVEQERVTVKLTEAQAREAGTFSLPINVTLNAKRLVFHGNYEEDAKVLVLKLEERIESLNKEGAALIDANRDLYFESDMGASEAARQIKGQVAKINGAAKACDAAMEAIAYGSLDDEYNILQWYEERKDARHGWITQEASEVAINALLGCVPKDATLEEATAAFEKFTTLRNDHPEWHPYVAANWSETLRKLVRDLTPETEEVV